MTEISRRVFLLVCLAASRGVAAVEFGNGFLIAEEQKSGSFVVIDGRNEGAPDWSWEWNPARDPGIPKSEVHDFRAPSDGKVLATSSRFRGIRLGATPMLLCARSGGRIASSCGPVGRNG